MLVCIEYIPIPPLRIGHVLMHVFRYVFACIRYWNVPIHTKYASNTCKIRINTDWYVSIHTRHVSIHTYNTYRNTYQNTYQYGAVVLVRICTYQVSIRALHFPDVLSSGHLGIMLGLPTLWATNYRQLEARRRWRGRHGVINRTWLQRLQLRLLCCGGTICLIPGHELQPAIRRNPPLLLVAEGLLRKLLAKMRK